MARINKIDFFSGAFLSYLVSNKVKEPTLFDASEKHKRLKFTLRDKEYNAYLKYAGNSKTITKSGKAFRSWSVTFTESEKILLNTSFAEENKENIIVLVCANEDFKDTYFALISLKDALRCLGNDNVNKQTNIVVKRQKGSKYVFCHGTALSEEKAIQLKYNFDEFFEF